MRNSIILVQRNFLELFLWKFFYYFFCSVFSGTSVFWIIELVLSYNYINIFPVCPVIILKSVSSNTLIFHIFYHIQTHNTLSIHTLSASVCVILKSSFYLLNTAYRILLLFQDFAMFPFLFDDITGMIWSLLYPPLLVYSFPFHFFVLVYCLLFLNCLLTTISRE